MQRMLFCQVVSIFEHWRDNMQFLPKILFFLISEKEGGIKKKKKSLLNSKDFFLLRDIQFFLSKCCPKLEKINDF